MQSLPYLNSKNRWWGPKWPLRWVSLFIGISQLLAQLTPPTDFLLRHSFDEQTVTFAQLDSATSLEQVNGLERLKFRRSNENRHVDQYVDATGQPATFITDNTVRDNPQGLPYPKYIVITANATTLYAANGKMLLQQQNLAEINAGLKIMAEDEITSIDAFTFPTVADATAVANDLTTGGYSANVSASGKVITAT